MATLNSIYFFFFLLLSPKCIFIPNVARAWEDLERQREEENVKSSENERTQIINVINNTPDTTYPSTTPTADSNPTLLTPFNPANPNPNPTPISTDPSSTNPSPFTTYPTTPSTETAANGPIIPGQTWCIARAGVPESSLQEGLDYACGIVGVDCSLIQPGASCYSPDSLENVASYAYNSYFQMNPVPSSCDFGGSAMLVNTDPSTGSCIYPSLATPTAMPTSTFPPATTTSSSGATGSYPGVGGSGPPSGFNTYNPTTGSPATFGPYFPPTGNTVPASSATLRPFIVIIVVASLSTGKLILNS